MLQIYPPLARKPKVEPVPAAEDGEVLLDQLADLIEHSKERTCGCPDCLRFMRVRAILMAPFAEPAMLIRARTVGR